MAKSNQKDPLEHLKLPINDYYIDFRAGSALKQGSVIFFPHYEVNKEIRVFAPNVPLTLVKEEVVSVNGQELKFGEFDIYDYYWKGQEDKLPISTWTPDKDEGMFKPSENNQLPPSLNNSFLMLARGKLRPMIVISDIETTPEESFCYPNNIVTLAITSYKSNFDPQKIDTLLLPPFPPQPPDYKRTTKYNILCLTTVQTIDLQLCSKCNPVAQLSNSALSLITEKFFACNFKHLTPSALNP